LGHFHAASASVLPFFADLAELSSQELATLEEQDKTA
jgi:hypothetical protein